MAPNQEQKSAKHKQSTDQASSSGKGKSSRKRSSHEQHRKMEMVEARPEDVGSKQAAPGNHIASKPKKGNHTEDGGVQRSAAIAASQGHGSLPNSAEGSHRGSKRQQNQGAEDLDNEAVGLVRSSKRWRSEASLVLAGPPTPPSPLDRWDGGQSQVEIGAALLPSFNSGKNIANFVDASAVDETASAILEKERDGQKDPKSRRGKVSVSRTRLPSESREIPTVKPPETLKMDGVAADRHAQAKTKLSRKKEHEPSNSGDGIGPRQGGMDLQDSAEAGRHVAADLAGGNPTKSGNRRRRDGDIMRLDEELGQEKKDCINSDSHVHDSSESKERNTRKERGGSRERSTRKERGGDARAAEPSKAERERLLEDREPSVSKRRSQDTDKRQPSFEDRDSRSSGWKIQEELRNIELEKELENRIRRRKEESSERDRWKDDDRDREARLHPELREDCVRELRTKDERHRKERHEDRHESPNHKQVRPLESKSRENRSHENDRDSRVSRNEHTGHKREEHIRAADHGIDQDTRERKVLHSKKEDIDGTRDSGEKGTSGINSLDCGIKANDRSRKRGHDSGLNVDGGKAVCVQEKPQLQMKDETDSGVHAECSNDLLVEQQAHGKSRIEKRKEHRSTGGSMSSHYEQPQASPSSKMGGSSPVADDQVPKYRHQRSPSPLGFNGKHPVSRVKTVRGGWLEPSYSRATSTGTHRHRDSGLRTRDNFVQPRRQISAEEEVKGGESGGVGTPLDNGIDSSPSLRRSKDDRMPLSPPRPPVSRQDTSTRASTGRNAVDTRNASYPEESASLDREHRRTASQGRINSFDSRASDESTPRERIDQGRQSFQASRSLGNPMARAPSLKNLPPPPPFRAGIDNPSVFGGPGGAYEEGSGPREHVRLDRKVNVRYKGGEASALGVGDGWRGPGISSWNPRNQGPGPGPGPGNAFPPYHSHHFRAHPPPMFPGTGQQFMGPPIFGPGGMGRAPMDMDFGRCLYMGPNNRLGDGESFHLPGRVPGWHSSREDDMHPPVLVQADGWEGWLPSKDDLRQGWDHTVGPTGGKPWERGDSWDGRPDFNSRVQFDPLPQPSPPGQGGSWGMPEGKVDKSKENKEKRERTPSKEPSAKGVQPDNSLVDKARKNAIALMRTLISKLDVSPELAGPKVYNEYQSFVSSSMASSRPNTDMPEKDEASSSSDDDCVLEADLEAETLLSQSRASGRLLPSLPDEAFEAALSRYRRPEEENRTTKSAIGSFILPDLPVNFHGLIKDHATQQPTTICPDNLGTPASITPLFADAGTITNVKGDYMESVNAAVIVETSSSDHCMHESAITVEVAAGKGTDVVDAKIDDKFCEGSLKGVQDQILDNCVVEAEHETCLGQMSFTDSESLYREEATSGTIVGEEVESLAKASTDKIVAIKNDHSEVHLPATFDELASVVKIPQAGKLFDAMPVESTEADLDEVLYGADHIATTSNHKITSEQDTLSIGDREIVTDTERVDDESQECVQGKRLMFLGKHVKPGEDGICIEGVDLSRRDQKSLELNSRTH